MLSATVRKLFDSVYKRRRFVKIAYLEFHGLSGLLFTPSPEWPAAWMPGRLPRRTGQKRIHDKRGEGICSAFHALLQASLWRSRKSVDVQIPSEDKIFILGKKSGTTTLFALDENGDSIASWTIRVEADRTVFTPHTQTESESASLQTSPNGAVMTGSVANADQADHLATAARGVEGKDHPGGKPDGGYASLQVNLRIRIAEVSRSVAQQIGFNWSTVIKAGSFAFGLQSASVAGECGRIPVRWGASTSHVNAQTVLDAMANEHLVTLLAEPNLTAISGSTATFLCRGEFPILVPQVGCHVHPVYAVRA